MQKVTVLIEERVYILISSGAPTNFSPLPAFSLLKAVGCFLPVSQARGASQSCVGVFQAPFVGGLCIGLLLRARVC